MKQQPLLSVDFSGTEVFTQTRVIRFSDCDPAGMVFYPQYFVMLNALVEDWFTQALGVNYAHLLGQRRIGLPTVALQSEFRAPCRMGDAVELRLQLERMGSRSLTLRVDCMHGPTCCVQIRQVLVSTSLSHDGAIEIPQDVREGVARWQSFTGDSR
jgi:4-hydroxybenzoyl-CoA thioesterase